MCFLGVQLIESCGSRMFCPSFWWWTPVCLSMSWTVENIGNLFLFLNSRSLCHTLSKGFAASRKTAGQYYFLSNDLLIVSLMRWPCWIVGWFGVTSCWSKFALIVFVTQAFPGFWRFSKRLCGWKFAHAVPSLDAITLQHLIRSYCAAFNTLGFWFYLEGRLLVTGHSPHWVIFTRLWY